MALEDAVYRASVAFLREYYPDDVPLFEILWPAARPYLDKLSGAGNRDAGVLALFPAMAGSVLDAPKYAALMVFHALFDEYPPETPDPASDQEVREVVQAALDRFPVPADLRTRLLFAAPVLYRSQVLGREEPHGTRQPPTVEAAIFAVWTRGGRHSVRRRQAERLHRLRASYDIWVDDTVPELRVLGAPISLQPGHTDAYLALKALLRRVGHRATYVQLNADSSVHPEVHREGDDATQMRAKLRYIKGVLVNHLDGSRLDRWLCKYRGGIRVTRELRTCLVAFPSLKAATCDCHVTNP